jgi:hypothetical protein
MLFYNNLISQDIVIDRSFEIPEPVVERSIQDDSLLNVSIPADNTAVEYTIVESGTERRKRKLVDSTGFSYSVKVKC